MCCVEAKGSTSVPDSNIIYGSNSKVTITKSKKTELTPEYIYTSAEICNSWHMFNCKKLFKLQIIPSSLILLITTSQDKWIFPSQSWDVKNSMVMTTTTTTMMMIIIKIIIMKEMQNLDRETRKLLNIHGQHHLKADIVRFCVPRKQGRRGLL